MQRVTLVLVACSLACSAPPKPYAPPAPDAWEKNAGPGGPRVSFAQDQLFTNCAFLHGEERDIGHHNLVTMYDGYLMMPWAPEWGLQAGVTFYDISDPCQPKAVGSGFSAELRESHSIGFSSIGGRWAVLNHVRGLDEGGIQFWDISDVTAPKAVSELLLPGFFYPDAYARPTLSVFWQGPYVYVAGADNGLYIVDARDPLHPALISQYSFEPTLRAFQVVVVGNVLFVSAAEGPRVALLDVSDPAQPQPIPGGDFNIHDREGVTQEAYSSTFANGYGFFARKSKGGGVIAYDLRDPTKPTFAGDLRSEGNGGYVFIKDNRAYVGESNFGTVYDITDLSNIREVARLNLAGDLDTVTPIGNVSVVAVDDKGEKGKETAIAPSETEPDTVGPRVTWTWPADGATGLALTSRFGVAFSEWVDVKSAFAGSVRLKDASGQYIRGYVSAQESIVNFWPEQPLKKGTRYTLEIPAGGIVDFNGNATATAFEASFTTAGG